MGGIWATYGQHMGGTWAYGHMGIWAYGGICICICIHMCITIHVRIRIHIFECKFVLMCFLS